MQTISNIAPVIALFLRGLKEQQPNLNTVYNEELDYSSAIKDLRAKNRHLGENPDHVFPLFAYRRNALRYNEDILNKRSISLIPRSLESNTNGCTYHTVSGTIEIEFALFMNRASLMEEMEIFWMSEVAQSKTLHMNVDLPEYINDFQYYMKFPTLDSKTITNEGTFNKSLTGTITISGFWFVAKGHEQAIEEIKLSLFNRTPKADSLISEHTIPERT